MADTIRIQLCYISPAEQLLCELEVASGTTLAEAVAASRLPDTGQFGIFGKKKPAETVLRDGDRIELYRPLLADPKDTRRRRAALRQRNHD
jgi:putative ubiquitin-RnfH superfamily antitoxin RatB of RatAB toxin-antitoxin module